MFVQINGVVGHFRQFQTIIHARFANTLVSVLAANKILVWNINVIEYFQFEKLTLSYTIIRYTYNMTSGQIFNSVYGGREEGRAERLFINNLNI